MYYNCSGKAVSNQKLKGEHVLNATFSHTQQVFAYLPPLQSFEDNMMYRLIGLLCGLAIYNSTIIDLKFPLALYKKLLGKSVILYKILVVFNTVVVKYIIKLCITDTNEIERHHVAYNSE